MSEPPEPPRFDRINQCVWWGERRVELSANAFRMLAYLVERPNQLVSKRELLDAVWPDSHVVDAVLSVTVSQLREAFEDDARRPRFIETLYGRGYRWIGILAREAIAPEPRAATVAFGEAARDDPGDTLLVGRGAAVADLEQAAARAASGRRQLVFVTGEPGVGKTTLVDHFLASPAMRDRVIARGQCIDAYGMEESYMPLLEALEQVVRGSDDAMAVLRSRAPTWLLQLPGLLSTDEHAVLARSLASSTGARMVRELQQALESLCREEMIVLVLEDLHWSDPATVSALAGLAMRREAAKLLVIATYRPVDAIAELHPIVQVKHELVAKRQCVEIALDGFQVDGVDEYLGSRFAGHAFAPEIARRLHHQTAGNPLFLQNAVEELQQRGWLACTEGTWRCSVDSERIDDAVPESTRAMIDARLARLPAASLTLLEAASVVGPKFASQALAAAVERDASEVEVEVAAMARARQFVKEIEATRWPDGTSGAQYAFRHALYQQELYRRVTAARRQRLHRAVAARLEGGFGADASEISGALALHSELGGDLDRAVTHLARAAQIARSRYSYEQAAAQFRHALDLLRRLPVGVARDSREIDLQSELIACVFSTDGPGAAELEQIAARIDTLSQTGETTVAMLNSLFGLIGFCITRGELGRAEELCARALRRSEGVEWAWFQAKVARGLLGFVQHRRGRLGPAIENLMVGAELPLIGASGMMEPSTGCLSDLGFSLILTGDLRRGLATIRDADARADASGHPPTIVFSSSNVIRVGQILRDRTLLEQVAAKMGDVGEWLASPRISGYRLLCIGWLRMDAGHADGIATLREGWERLASDSHRVYSPFSAQQAGALLLRLGRIDQARDLLDEGFALLDATGARWCEAELHRLRGEIALAGAVKRSARAKGRERATIEAEESFRRAIEVAQAQGARWWELRARLALARSLPPERREAETTERLRDLLAAVDDGSDVADLREVRAFLASA